MTFNTIEELREARNQALENSDWMVLPDVTFEDYKIALIRIYRQQLRDLPQRAEEVGLENIEFPQSPF
jgi:hypothetical protein